MLVLQMLPPLVPRPSCVLNIGFIVLPLEALLAYLYSQLVYLTGEFQVLLPIVIAVFSTVEFSHAARNSVADR